MVGSKAQRAPAEAFDTIVIGAGHNGLTAAAYLARGGRRVLVLERRDVIGGCAVTEEVDPQRAPGCRVSTASYIASMLRPEVIHDLRLEHYGLKMVACEPGVQAAFEDGDVVSWWNDPHRLHEELIRIAPEDAGTFIDTQHELKKLATWLQPFFLEPPPQLESTGLARVRELIRLAGRFRGISGAEIAGLTRFLTMSLGDFLDQRFRSDKLKRLILANSLYGQHGGPYHRGTAMGLLFHLLSGGEEAKQGFQGHVIGGMGAITEAMARACADLGVTIRTGAKVRRINQSNGRVQGVTLDDGSVLEASTVVSNADPKNTFLRMLTPSDLPSQFTRQVQGIKMNGPCAKVNYVLSQEPNVRGMPASHSPTERALFTLVPTLADAERCYNTARAGGISYNLWVDCVLASNVDPTLAPPGRHMLTCFVQYLPYRPVSGTWDDHRESLGDQVTEIIGRYAPNMPNSVIARRVLTPRDLEQRFAITEGNIFHGDITLDQLFFNRPLAGWAHYRTPIEGLFMCGAGTHPGGGVTGAPGYNAAHVILSSRGR